MLLLLKSFILIPVIIGFFKYKIMSQEREQNPFSIQTPLDWMGVCHQRFGWYHISSLLALSFFLSESFGWWFYKHQVDFHVVTLPYSQNWWSSVTVDLLGLPAFCTQDIRSTVWLTSKKSPCFSKYLKF